MAKRRSSSVRAPQPSDKGCDLLRRWLDDAERQLTAQAERAGIFKHPSITGDVREAIVRDALRHLLPPAVEIGKGKVIGSDCEPSQQIDIVIFDGRFPILRQGDDALYPVEGVIATVQVKSLLTRKEMANALENAFSVMRMSPSFVKEDADAWIARLQSSGATREQAIEELVWQLMPRTYVFAFRGFKTIRSQAESLRKCFSTKLRTTPSRPLIPSVIVGGNIVTVAIDPRIRIQVDDPQQQRQIDDRGIAINIESPTRFGIMVCHLMLHLEQRTLMLEPPGSICRAVQTYLPFAEYINDRIRNCPFGVTLWHERKVWAFPDQALGVADPSTPTAGPTG